MNRHITVPATLRLIVASLCIAFAGISAFAGDTEQERLSWLLAQMKIIETMKPGTTSERLLEFFVGERGVTVGADGKHAWTYWLKGCRVIKVDVQFEEDIGAAFELKPGNRIKWISKPYLAQPNIG